MKYMADEMLEKLPQFLHGTGIECRTVHEWVLGSKQKTRDIRDSEIRRFLMGMKEKGDEVTLITNDEDSCDQVRADGLPVIYVPELVRDYVMSKAKDH